MTLYLLPQTVTHIEKYLSKFHGELLEQKAYLFYSRNTGIYGNLSEALATLEEEKDKAVIPKWKHADGSLVGFCKLKP